MRPESQAFHDLSAASFAHKGIVMSGELDLARLRKLLEKQCRYRKTQNPIAEKLQPLVVPAALFRSRTRMGKSLSQKAPIVEGVAEMVLKLFSLDFFCGHSVNHVSDTGPADLQRPAPG